jgi:branched-chain amino acid transport system substrate-binding protein
MRRSLLVAVAVLALLAQPLASRGADTTPFEIYITLAITGQLAFVGQRAQTAFLAEEKYINAHGGIRGRPVKLVIQDNQSNPQIEVQLMNGYLAKKPSLLIGGLFAALCLADSALLNKDTGPVLFCFSPAVHPAPGSWVYSGGFTTTYLYDTALRYFRMKGFNKIALLTTLDATGQDADNSVPELLAMPENRGITIVAREHYALADLSIAAQLARIQSSGAQAMILWATGTPFATAVRGLRDAGIEMPVYTSQGNLVYSQLEAYKNLWPTTTPVLMGGIPPITPEAIPDRRVRRAIDTYLTAMKAAGIERPDISQAITWDPLQIFVEAYRHYGTDATAAQIRDYVNGITNWPGIQGILNFKAAPQRGVQGDWLNIVRWNPDSATFTAVSKPGGAPL